MSATEEARQEIARLVAKYQSLDEKAIRKYSEADTRRAFIATLRMTQSSSDRFENLSLHLNMQSLISDSGKSRGMRRSQKGG